MVRWYTSGLWFHPAVSNRTTVLRLDTDACYTAALPAGLPHLESCRHVYRPNVLATDKSPVVDGLWKTVREYVLRNGIKVRNRGMWNYVAHVWETAQDNHHKEGALSVLPRPCLVAAV